MKNDLTLIELIEKSVIANVHLFTGSWYLLAGIMLGFLFLSEISRMKNSTDPDFRLLKISFTFGGFLFSFLLGVSELLECFK
jgi:hypothetical protein